jgi:AraC family transcriptional regulator
MITEAEDLKSCGHHANGEARFETPGPLAIAGLRRQFTASSDNAILQQWKDFALQLGGIPGPLKQMAYGVCVGCGGMATFDYLCGVEVTGLNEIPPHWDRLWIPEQTYAVFAHHGPVSKLRETIRGILEEWLPNSDCELPETGPDIPDFLERYGTNFNPETGLGDIELWIPIERNGNPARNVQD